MKERARRFLENRLRWAQLVDDFNDRLGVWVGWCTALLVVLGAGNALARYIGRQIGQNLSSNALLELQSQVFSLIFLLGAAHTLRANAHVRVDVLYGRLGPRWRAWIDIVGTIVLLIPFCIFAIWVSLPSVRNSWAVLEISPNPDGLPLYPIKTVIPIAFYLVLRQGIASLVKNIAFLSGVGEPPTGPAGTPM